MKNTLAVIIVTLTSFFLLLFIYTKIVGPIPFQINNINTNKTDTFNVTGEGTVLIKPDIATINAGIESSAPTVKATKEQINTVASKIASSVKALGVEEKDVKTINYSIYPTYDYKENVQKIIGYRANATLTIKVRNIDKVNEVIDAATGSGANQVSNIQFDVDDKSKAENEARQKAVADAKQKAQSAAKIAGFSLGRMVNYQEDFNAYPKPLYTNGVQLDAKIASPTQVEPGSSEIKINVTLSYEIR